MNKYFKQAIIYTSLITSSSAAHYGTLVVDRPDDMKHAPFVSIKDSNDNIFNVINPRELAQKEPQSTKTRNKTKAEKIALLKNNHCIFIDHLDGKKVAFNFADTGMIDIQSIKPIGIREYLSKKVTEKLQAKSYMSQYILGIDNAQITKKVDAFLDELESSESHNSNGTVLNVGQLHKEFISLSEKVDVKSRSDASFQYLLEVFLDYKLTDKKSAILERQNELKEQITSLRNASQEILDQRSYTRLGQYVRNSRQYDFVSAFEAYVNALSPQ